MRVYKFSAADGSQDSLASRLRAAGHDVVAINDDFVVMRPMEDISDQPLESWVSDMQEHFRCEYAERSNERVSS